MNTRIARLVLALLVLAGGELLRRAADVEEALAATRERLLLRGAAIAPEAYGDIEAALGPLRHVPWYGARVAADLRAQRATAAYWRGDYAAALAVAGEADQANDAGVAAAGTSPGDTDLRWLAANARYRQALRDGGDRPALLRALDGALQAYRDLLARAPGHAGAAWNFEFVSRLRTALARDARAEPPAGDGPPNVNGTAGEPPEGTRPAEFNVIVPLRPDERDDQFDAGQGGVTRRRG